MHLRSRLITRGVTGLSTAIAVAVSAAAFTRMPGAAGSPLVDGFYELTTGVAEWARRYSPDIDVAYVHTEFFGGGGFHAAVAWACRDNRVGAAVHGNLRP